MNSFIRTFGVTAAMVIAYTYSDASDNLMHPADFIFAFLFACHTLRFVLCSLLDIFPRVLPLCATQKEHSE